MTPTEKDYVNLLEAQLRDYKDLAVTYRELIASGDHLRQQAEAEVTRVNSECDAWRARWRESQDEIRRLEGRD